MQLLSAHRIDELYSVDAEARCKLAAARVGWCGDLQRGGAEFQSRLDVEGAVPLLGGPADYAALIAKESALWAGIVKASGASVD